MILILSDMINSLHILSSLDTDQTSHHVADQYLNQLIALRFHAVEIDVHCKSSLLVLRTTILDLSKDACIYIFFISAIWNLNIWSCSYSSFAFFASLILFFVFQMSNISFSHLDVTILISLSELAFSSSLRFLNFWSALLIQSITLDCSL